MRYKVAWYVGFRVAGGGFAVYAEGDVVAVCFFVVFFFGDVEVVQVVHEVVVFAWTHGYREYQPLNMQKYVLGMFKEVKNCFAAFCAFH